ncbi:unnamed protein product [Victoria cruziana]
MQDGSSPPSCSVLHSLELTIFTHDSLPPPSSSFLPNHFHCTGLVQWVAQHEPVQLALLTSGNGLHCTLVIIRWKWNGS